MYFEDADLCRKIKMAGGQIVFFPRIEVIHAGGKFYENPEKQKKDYYAAQERYFKKNRPFFEWFLIKIIGRVFFF
jgi:GT2 family glycosyltransferase